ncbi:unnamed protein product [Vicia faba]|uniref:Uncharacterized protein n=1 Tax=Vicia faba TaxID=3906 RepID=A0AAV0Z5F4_VICFA|nr:unnamed protein product [Vicia faba]
MGCCSEKTQSPITYSLDRSEIFVLQLSIVPKMVYGPSKGIVVFGPQSSLIQRPESKSNTDFHRFSVELSTSKENRKKKPKRRLTESAGANSGDSSIDLPEQIPRRVRLRGGYKQLEGLDMDCLVHYCFGVLLIKGRTPSTEMKLYRASKAWSDVDIDSYAAASWYKGYWKT